LVEGGGIESVEDVFSFWKNGFPCSFFLLEEVFDLFKVGFLKFIREESFSRRLDLDSVNIYSHWERRKK
jgi:hypothetical protein